MRSLPILWEFLIALNQFKRACFLGLQLYQSEPRVYMQESIKGQRGMQGDSPVKLLLV